MNIQLSEHAKTEILRRQLSEDEVRQVACQSEQVVPARDGLECRQSQISDSLSGKDYLLRVIVNPWESSNVVVTAYKTSKLGKYWKD